jgi:hypothetical protein
MLKSTQAHITISSSTHQTSHSIIKMPAGPNFKILSLQQNDDFPPLHGVATSQVCDQRMGEKTGSGQ